MSFDSWDDLRIALAVARTGTVSAAAHALDVHHATVIRRIDGLEQQLGVKLFQRHPRGYALTEAGQVMLKVAGDADERFAQLAAQIAGSGDRIEGELVVTSLPELADLVMPRLIRLMRQHPGLRINYVTDVRLFRLDAGEAHVAIRAGSQPTEPDYVVRPMGALRHPIYASPEYLAAHGDVTDIGGHPLALMGPQSRNAPLMRWLQERIDPAQVVLTSGDETAREAVIRAGLAIGPLPPSRAEGLVEVMALPEWESRLWLVTHVDLHRSPKVQAAVAALRDA
ncbi:MULTISPECIES: LysR family transcriptional regulator [Paracoccus]|uniref:LysR family transcriptional regulator n=1 Tax=Paracoccus aerius TaxID=1915382 RepID=A0ABS1S2N4_9RHOB|nr:MULTISPECIES: LysR family transcriptional regulator [Paracoccus]MBL3672978.1 LysR family transcriptional regulator [Paracoccus aerius]QIR84309.1 LysR family transcriptional regulator [Paracoccus sp. AK26]